MCSTHSADALVAFGLQGADRDTPGLFLDDRVPRSGPRRLWIYGDALNLLRDEDGKIYTHDVAIHSVRPADLLRCSHWNVLRNGAVVLDRVLVDRRENCMCVITTLCVVDIRRRLYRAEGDHHDRGENRDDADDEEKFHEGDAADSGCLHSKGEPGRECSTSGILHTVPLRYALLSCSDTTGLIAFARNLVASGHTILATDGTRRALAQGGMETQSVETVTGFPACLGGRVKTLHPLLLGGILFRRHDPAQCTEATQYGMPAIDVVAVNLYPFRTRVTAETPQQEAMEFIDIGGVTLLRAAAKNWKDVIVVCDPADYACAADAAHAGVHSAAETLALRRSLAAKAFRMTAAYDAAIARHLTGESDFALRATPDRQRERDGIMLTLTNGMTLRYGENPHQRGWWFQCTGPFFSVENPPLSWEILQGKPLSYCNILDADAACGAAQEFPEPTAVFVKHCTPSGIASHDDIVEAFRHAYDADRLSAFGVIIALNRPCTEGIARSILDRKIFAEVLVAPAFADAARELLKAKPNLRLLVIPSSLPLTPSPFICRSALGGILVQESDAKEIAEVDLRSVTEKRPTSAQIRDLLFAWRTVKHCRSNAVVFARDNATVGIGSGQTSRVDAVWIAAKRAGEKSKGAAMASDAFFPFPDAVEEAARCGIAAIVQPGGSIRDAEVFATANRLGIAMVTTNFRAFRH